MKSFLALLASLTLSVSALAFTDGEYTCGTKTDKFQTTYKITTLDMNGLNLPHLEVTSIQRLQDSPEKTYNIKGIATQFNNDQGEEILVLGNITLGLTGGRPGCVK